MTISDNIKRLLLGVVALGTLLTVHAVQIPQTQARGHGDVSSAIPPAKRSDGTSKVQFGYFIDWDTFYANGNYQPSNISVENLTHILYGYADDSSTGQVMLGNEFVDIQKLYPGDSTDDDSSLKGCFKQMYLLKLQNRNLKVVLSVRGSYDFLNDTTKRTMFAGSATSMIKTYGFDGIDVVKDGFPITPERATQFTALLKEMRTSFDTLQATYQERNPYLLTFSLSANPDDFFALKDSIVDMDAVLDYWHLRAYDYAGSWSNVTGNQANLYGSTGTFSADRAIQWYTNAGASAHKITLGMPVYGRSFMHTDGLGKPFDGSANNGNTIPYKNLTLESPDVSLVQNLSEGYSYTYNLDTRELISFDSPDIARLKAQYVLDHGLAGSMFFDLSGDKTGADSLVAAIAGVYGALAQTENHVHYPDSSWPEIAGNMGYNVTSSGAGPGNSSSTSVVPSSTASGSSSVPTSSVPTTSSSSVPTLTSAATFTTSTATASPSSSSPATTTQPS